LSTFANGLPDGDKRLANALQRAAVVLGFVLDPDRAKTVPVVPIVTRGPLPFAELWRAAGAVGPVPELEQAARGIGALSLPGDADGLVRRVPLLVDAADTLLPGLAVEAVRVLQRASTYLIQAEPPMLRIGELVIVLPRDALLRLVPVAEHQRAARTLSAVDVLEGKADASRITGAVALVGGSAPELGGLRQTTVDPLAPSIQIQADAVGQIVAGRVPLPLDAAKVVEPLLLIGAGAVAIAA